jgi:enoyl-CoA hydratase
VKDLLDDPPVLLGIEGGCGRITLNRPGALHALTLQMCQLMIGALQAWRSNPAVKAVLIDHSGPRGFCAGGDIRMLAESGAGDGAQARAFFFTEYRLNHLLFTYPKPVVALMDGVTMGGGVGLAMPSRFRVATERTTFAMPETGIGLFPDVGGGYFLSRCPGVLGEYLALTGQVIGAGQAIACGLADVQISADAQPGLWQALSHTGFEDSAQALAWQVQAKAPRRPRRASSAAGDPRSSAVPACSSLPRAKAAMSTRPPPTNRTRRSRSALPMHPRSSGQPCHTSTRHRRAAGAGIDRQREAA